MEFDFDRGSIVVAELSSSSEKQSSEDSSSLSFFDRCLTDVSSFELLIPLEFSLELDFEGLSNTDAEVSSSEKPSPLVDSSPLTSVDRGLTEGSSEELLTIA